MIWAVLLATLALVGCFQIGDPFRMSPQGIIPPAGLALLLCAIATYYRNARPDPRIVAMTIGLAQMILFSALGAVLSYMVAARGGPLWDDRITRWDSALGLDWLSSLRWMDQHARVAPLLKFAYLALMPQMAAMIVALALYGRLATLRVALLAAMMAGLIAILLSGMMPAVGPYAHFGVRPDDFSHIAPAVPYAHMEHLTGLRDGTLRTLSIATMQGIISFPSYHAALAAVFGWGFSRVPGQWIRWPGKMMAALTLAATPIDGGHYFSDVIAGCLIATFSLWAAHRATRQRLAGNAPTAKAVALIPGA